LNTFKFALLSAAIFASFGTYAQQVNPLALKSIAHDTIRADSSRQKDIVDVYQQITKSSAAQKRDVAGKFNFSLIPYVGYSLSTGLIGDVSGNAGFYTATDHKQNLSVITSDIGFDSKNQKIVHVRSEIWGSGNEFKIVSDLRFEVYPTETYGLGTLTTPATEDPIKYTYVRIYETALKKVVGSLYAGVGYNLDDHYNIKASGNENGTESDFAKYGQPTSSISSGFNVEVLMDNRLNPINPLGGTYASLVLRQNAVFLGSDNSWKQLKADLRKYFKLSDGSSDVLAVWVMGAFTSGYAPYLDLPATGADMYNTSGRGYEIGRFRGKDELYFETEYRFGVTRNGLIGAVVFANAESFTGLQSNTFAGVAPAAGPGLRIKVNKHSDTNLCIDYGVGIKGSHGLFVNLGELF
jgi:outer membrane protein assembly factor BamA